MIGSLDCLEFSLLLLEGGTWGGLLGQIGLDLEVSEGGHFLSGQILL